MTKTYLENSFCGFSNQATMEVALQLENSWNLYVQVLAHSLGSNKFLQKIELVRQLVCMGFNHGELKGVCLQELVEHWQGIRQEHDLPE